MEPFENWNNISKTLFFKGLWVVENVIPYYETTDKAGCNYSIIFLAIFKGSGKWQFDKPNAQATSNTGNKVKWNRRT